MPDPHPTPQSPQVTVRGEARLEKDPEIARIGIEVTARGTDKTAVLADLTRRNTEALTLIKTYGEAVEKLETGAFSITPEASRRGRGEHVRSYRGWVHLTAELSDFTALGELTTRLADLEWTRVDGPWWELRPDSPAHAEARRRAVQDAVRRAGEYAAALGTSLAALLELSDTGLVPPPAPMGGMRMAFAAESVDTTPPLELEPQRQTVTAEVMARFTMAPPTL
ncbi:SIMPL domain-containing protein [Streptomyces vilmorinianum]|uniref:SIMPL domain-containing protein n=1 Tax=Streptomyces vilmorinianum TaxID=3051092 RepID=UPI0010FBB73A|nr:SIMPL domain-containing protein [Streptomyces vilmorinianum]